MQEEYFGIGCLDSLTDIVSRNHPNNVLLVTGRKSFEMCGVKDKIDALLRGFQVVRFFDFGVNPKIEDIQKGIVLFRKENIDMVVAVGGGSVIDIAKSINLLSMQTETPEQYIKKNKKIERPGKPLVAIPTTAGTGSEATSFAVVYIGDTKFSLEHEYVLPNYVIIDPSLTICMSPYLTACTGIDALAQGIESYWAVGSTKESKQYAKEAIGIIWKNLDQAVIKGEIQARIAMSRGSNLSGKAINISKTTAPHACSYVITARFGIPHGHAVGITLGAFLAYNADVNESDVIDKRGAEYVRKTIREICILLGCADAMEFRKKLKALMKSIGLAISLADLGIVKREDKQYIIEHINLERIENNPRRVTREALKSIVEL